MPPSTRRNAALYPWYVACLNGYFWFPVFFLYLSDRVGVADALVLESIYYVAVVALEVPSGWASDRFGRRLTLRVAMAALTVAYLAFFFGESFVELAFAQIVLAAGYAFNSGTDTAFHYDSLVAAGREAEYADREAAIAKLGFGMVAASAVLGGLAGSVDYRWAYALAAVSAGCGFAITMMFVEIERSAEETAERIDRQIIGCVRRLSDPLLAWVFGFSVVLTALIHIPYQFYQPYIDLLGIAGGWDVSTPLLTGLHGAAAMVVASVASGYSVRLARRFGLRTVALFSMASTVGVIALMGALLHPVVAFALVFRSLSRALTVAPMNAVIAPRVPARMRASYLSVQSLAGRLSFGALLFCLSWIATANERTWTDISTMALVSAAVGAVGIAILAATSRAVNGDESL